MASSIERKNKWKAEGRCFNCGGENDRLPLLRCTKCGETVKKYITERRRRWKGEGKCMNCGGPNDKLPQSRCIKCEKLQTKRHIKYRAKRVVNNECIDCGSPKESSKFQRCDKCSTRSNNNIKRLRIDYKLAAFDAYGGRFCQCCNESILEMLNIDHINGDGNKQRREILGAKGSGMKFYKWLKDQGYPPGYRILCFNCNIGAYNYNGTCPHNKTILTEYVANNANIGDTR